MIEAHGYTLDGRFLGTRVIEQDNISDRTAINLAFFDLCEMAANGDLHTKRMNHDEGYGNYAVSLNMKIHLERKPCTKPALSPSSRS